MEEQTEDLPKEEAKQVFKTFQDAYDAWFADEKKDDLGNCQCSLPLLPLESEMEFETWYCDRRWRFIKKAEKNSVGYTVYVDKKCPLYGKQEHDERIGEIAAQYTTPDGLPMTFETFDTSVDPGHMKGLTVAMGFAKDGMFNGNRHLIIFGETGRGKTHLARAIYVGALDLNKTATWLRSADLAELFRRIQTGNRDTDDRQKAMATYRKATRSQFVVIDDLLTERVTENPEFFLEQFQNFLDKLRGVLVVTTNGTSKSFMERYGQKITSRILQNAYGYQLKGEDYRSRYYPKTNLTTGETT